MTVVTRGWLRRSAGRRSQTTTVQQMPSTSQAIPTKTAYESYVVERVVGQAAAAAGDAATAARTLEAAANSSAAPEGERKQILAAAAGQYYAIKEYGKAAELANAALRTAGLRAMGVPSESTRRYHWSTGPNVPFPNAMLARVSAAMRMPYATVPESVPT